MGQLQCLTFLLERKEMLYISATISKRFVAILSQRIEKLDKVEVFESTDWEECLKQCEQLLYVPNWFSGEFLGSRFFRVYLGIRTLTQKKTKVIRLKFDGSLYTSPCIKIFMCVCLDISFGPSGNFGRVVDMKTTFTQ